MSVVAGSARLLAAGVLGVFAGAMLTEGAFLVPWWRSLPPAEFLAWYAANDRRLFGYFAPLTAAAALVAIAAAILSALERHGRRWLTVLAAALALAAVATFFAYFEHANASFATGTLPVEAVPGELARWATWHTGRVGLSLAALVAALLALPTRD